MRVFPVVNNLLHVVERVEQEMITPFSPADGHGAISVHTRNENYSMPKEHLQHGCFPTNSFRNADIVSSHKEVIFLLCHLAVALNIPYSVPYRIKCDKP